MCHYLSLSCCNPHPVIRSNCRTPLSQRQFSCTPTLVSPLSTSCCICTLSAVCCLEVRVRGRCPRILYNTCILLDFSSFLCFLPAPYLCNCGPCGMWFFFVAGGAAAVIAAWTWRGVGDCAAFLFFFFTPSPLWCLALTVRGCGGVCTLLAVSRLVMWCQWLLLD